MITRSIRITIGVFLFYVFFGFLTAAVNYVFVPQPIFDDTLSKVGMTAFFVGAIWPEVVLSNLFDPIRSDETIAYLMIAILAVVTLSVLSSSFSKWQKIHKDPDVQRANINERHNNKIIALHGYNGSLYQSPSRMQKLRANSSVWWLWVTCLIAVFAGLYFCIVNFFEPGMVSAFTAIFSPVTENYAELILHRLGVLSVLVFFVASILFLQFLAVVPEGITKRFLRILCIFFAATLNIIGVLITGLLLWSYPRFLRVINQPVSAAEKPAAQQPDALTKLMRSKVYSVLLAIIAIAIITVVGFSLIQTVTEGG